jgi:hypothetical protein
MAELKAAALGIFRSVEHRAASWPAILSMPEFTGLDPNPPILRSGAAIETEPDEAS